MKIAKIINETIPKTTTYLLLLVIIITFPGCNNIYNNKYLSDSANGIYFDTIISITIYDTNNETIKTNLQSCLDICQKYEQLLNANIEGSDIYKINNSNGETINLSEETIYLLDKSLQYSELSNGLFDITIKSATSLWDFHEEKGVIPDVNLINNALEHINYKNLSIDKNNHTAILNDPDSQIDIGGIAKGYIADKISEYLNEQAVHGAIINIGGDITLIGNKNENENFNIGITNPFKDTNPILAINTTNKAIATSGTYERAFTYNNKSYHHILDPKTGFPVETDVISATTITDKGIDADTLCTISILLGSDEAIKLIENIPNTEAIIICQDQSILYTSGAKSYINSSM